jgi:hypothetical protein
MVKASKIDGQYPYNVYSVNLTVELIKLIFSLAYVQMSNQNRISSGLDQITCNSFHWDSAKLFGIPSLIYALYNLLAMMNQKLLEPATYRLLINTKIISSGLLFQYFFNKKLGTKQWFALVLLVLGCVVEQTGNISLKTDIQDVILSLALMSVQVFS